MQKKKVGCKRKRGMENKKGWEKLRKRFVWFKQIIPSSYGQTTVCLIATNSLFDNFCFI